LTPESRSAIIIFCADVSARISNRLATHVSALQPVEAPSVKHKNDEKLQAIENLWK
jgi:hypothetical protein